MILQLRPDKEKTPEENTPHTPINIGEEDRGKSDCHSEQFGLRVQRIFGRKLEYGDGPLD